VLQKAINNLELVVASQTRMIEGLQRDIIERQEALQLAITRHQVEAFQALNVKVDTLQLAQTQILGALGSITEPLLRSLRTFRVSVSLGLRRPFTTHTLSLCNHISEATRNAAHLVLTGRRGLRRPRARNDSEADKPQSQKASTLEAGPQALALSSAFVELYPTLPYSAWVKIRKEV
jgi:uncharacterized coiled-coil protein SlyX